jgi:shikimate kinase
MHSKLVRTPGLFLIGFMGSGKTTVGEALADELGWSFADLDEDIETAAGRSITEIFELLGEAEFRRLEQEALAKRARKIQFGQPMVLSLGGGAYTRPENVELVSNSGISIWLDCPLELVQKRISSETHRPLARDRARFEQLYHERKCSYALADFRIEITCDDPLIAVGEILRLPLF